MQHVTELLNKASVGLHDLEVSSSYYDANVRLEAIGIAVPEPMRVLTAAIGWPRMYVDSIEERLDVEGFRLGDNMEQVERLKEWWQANDLDEESGLAHLDALVYGRSYITVGMPGPNDDSNVPIIRVESPLNMFVDVDPRTRLVTRAVRVYRNPQDGAAQWATLFLPHATVYLKFVNGKWQRDGAPLKHNLGQVPVVPILNRERLGDREGASEITAELRSFTDAASRVMMNMQAAAELMAVPQRVLFGVDPSSLAPNGTPGEILNSYLANILAIDNPEAKAQQFQAAELMNFVNVLQELSKHVASYTGLPPQYLSFSSENPASAEAIRSSESRLVKKAERKGRMFGGAWERVMRLAILIMDGNVPEEMKRLEMVWRDPSTPTYAAKADGVMKLYAAGQGVIPKEQARIDMEYTAEQRDAMKEWDKEDKAEMVRLADVLGAQAAKNAPKPAPGQPGNAQTTKKPSASTSSTPKPAKPATGTA